MVSAVVCTVYELHTYHLKAHDRWRAATHTPVSFVVYAQSVSLEITKKESVLIGGGCGIGLSVAM